MTPRVIEARYARDYVLHVQFSDGQAGDVDLEGELYGESSNRYGSRRTFANSICGRT